MKDLELLNALMSAVRALVDVGHRGVDWNRHLEAVFAKYGDNFDEPPVESWAADKRYLRWLARDLNEVHGTVELIGRNIAVGDLLWALHRQHEEDGADGPSILVEWALRRANNADEEGDAYARVKALLDRLHLAVECKSPYTELVPLLFALREAIMEWLPEGAGLVDTRLVK